MSQYLCLYKSICFPPDGLCDDGRFKDDRNVTKLLDQRKAELKSVNNEKELVKGLLEICQELSEHVKGR